MKKTKIKRGHTVFTNPEGKIAVHDDSHETCVVDTTRPIEIHDRSASIPVVEDGCSTIAPFAEAMFIADATGMKIHTTDGIYRVVRVDDPDAETPMF